MIKINSITCLLLLSLGLHRAYAVQPKDTMSVNVPKINIIDSRNSSGIFKYYSGSSLNYKQISNINATQVSEILASSPGVFIKNYGGLGGLKTISIRGASSGQTSILLDGVPINSSQNGSFDLSLFPASFINGVDVVRGGAGAVFGGGAMGGAVNLRTDATDLDSTKLNLSYASFGTINASVSSGFNSGSSLWLLSGEYVYSKGDYPFSFNQFGQTLILKRDNGDFRNFSLAVFNSNNIACDQGDFKLGFKAIASSSDRGAPGAVLQGKIEADSARLKDDIVYLFTTLSRTFNENSHLSIVLMGKYQSTNYYDPTQLGISFSGDAQNFYNRDLALSAKYFYSKDKLSHEIYLNLDASDLRGDMLDLSVGDYVSRNSLALSYRAESEFSISNFKTLASAALRYDQVGTAGSAFSPLLAFSVSPENSNLKLRLQYSGSFRPPSFNEAYYYNFGNKDLKPERSQSVNLGLNYSLLSRINFSAELFTIYSKDKIIAIPKSPMIWSATNLSKSQTDGFEFSINTTCPEIYINSIDFNYTYQNPIDKTEATPGYDKIQVYIPKELISGSIKWEYWGIVQGTNLEYTSGRYYSRDNDINSYLPSYLIINAYIYKQIDFGGLSAVLRFDCMNLSDEAYAVVNNYPMPGRSYKFSINFKK